MKKIIAVVLTLLILLLAGCGDIVLPDVSKDSDSAAESVQSSDVEESSDEEENSVPEEEGMDWPSVIPSEIPKLEGVVIEGYYPQIKGLAEYTINFSIEKEDEEIILSYIDTLAAKGFVQQSLDENKFGFNYFGSSDKYSVFINLGYGGLSKIGITKK